MGQYQVENYLVFSSIFFSNEIPILHKLINTKIYFQLGCSKIINRDTNHFTVNFVDDSTNIMGYKNSNGIRDYLEGYFSLLIKYYNINKLKLNNDKTKLMTSGSGRLLETTTYQHYDPCTNSTQV